MELTKVKEIINYTGRIYVIRPYIEDGKIKRNSIYTTVKTSTSFNNFGTAYNLGSLGNLEWWNTTIHRLKPDEVVDDNTIASCITDEKPKRFFTDRESAKKALEEFEVQNTYNLSDSIDIELKYLENERKKINDKIKELKERRKECFSKLTTTFAKKS